MIAKALSRCYLVMRNYGKPPEMIASTVTIFCEVFASRDAADVVKAIEKYLREGTDFPTPADITAVLKTLKAGVEVV